MLNTKINIAGDFMVIYISSFLKNLFEWGLTHFVGL